MTRNTNKKYHKKNKTKRIQKGGNIVGSLMALGKGVTEKVIQKGINSVGNLVNVDTTNKTPSEVINEIKMDINNPETRRAIYNLGTITAAAVEAAKPGIDKIIDTGSVMAEKVGKKAILIGRDLLGEIPIIGPLIELPILVSDIVKAGEEVTEQGAKILGTGTETIANMKKAIEDTKNKLESEINTLTNDVNGFQNQMDNYQNQSNNIVNRVNNSMDEFNNPQNRTETQNQQGGKKTRKYKNRKYRKTRKNLYICS